MSIAINCRINLGSRVTGIPLYANAGVFSKTPPKYGYVKIKGPLTNGEVLNAQVLGWADTQRDKSSFNFEVVEG